MTPKHSSCKTPASQPGSKLRALRQGCTAMALAGSVALAGCSMFRAPGNPGGDAATSDQVRQQLARTAGAEGGSIEVDTIDGTVLLTGVVSSSARRDAAGREAQRVRGVRHVRNQIIIKP